jgi:hypothetical protein
MQGVSSPAASGSAAGWQAQSAGGAQAVTRTGPHQANATDGMLQLWLGRLRHVAAPRPVPTSAATAPQLTFLNKPAQALSPQRH